MPADAIRKDIVGKVRRVVVKLGSYVLTTASWSLDRKVFTDVTDSIAALRVTGIECVVVSSGAVASGMGRLGLKERPRQLPQEQAAAAVGQISLMAYWEKMLSRHGLHAAQILLTQGDVRDRKRFLNARHTLTSVLEYGAVPIINENDTVTVDEIKFGDNDYLSSLVTNLAQADLLIILTDIDGVYDKDPRANADAKLLPLIKTVDESIEELVFGSTSKISRGGMATKIKAAKTAALFGVPTIIANGKRAGVLQEIFAARQVGTLILPEKNKITSRKHWIAFTLKPHGVICVDDGAKTAMKDRGRSLLPSGIVSVKGDFGPDEAVSCCDKNGIEFARGLVKYGSDDIDKIKGLKTDQIEEVLGHFAEQEIIHRDDMVILG